MKNQTKIVTGDELAEFDQWVTAQPGGSFLQSSSWAAVKSLNGWSAKTVVLYQGDKIAAGAQIFVRKLPFGQKLCYLPHGPVWDPQAKGSLKGILSSLQDYTEGIAVRAEPYEIFSDEVAKTFRDCGFTEEVSSMQPAHTIIIDLSQSESELLAGMRQTTRRYIRQAERLGLRVWEDKSGEKIDEFYEILVGLGRRIGFGVHNERYYREIKSRFGDQARLFFVARGEQLLGSYFLVTQGQKCWELYGGVTDAGQELKAGYLLKWHCLLAMKSSGVSRYDQWGVAPEGDPKHHLAGVTYFKEGFGGQRMRMLGSYDLIRSPIFYWLGTLAEALLRRRG